MLLQSFYYSAIIVLVVLIINFIPDDRHRVKLHSLLADPSSEYVNANYIDVSTGKLEFLIFLLLPLYFSTFLCVCLF